MWWLLGPALAATPPVARVHVDRTARELYVLAADGTVAQRVPVGVGRGGLGPKTAMSDLITPTGTFTVDLVLTHDGRHDAVAPPIRTRYASDATLGPLVASPTGLRTLFSNMSALDFDRDGTPDHAYGSAYVGLDATDVVTGPKLRYFRGTPYWYSIALHGTPDPTSLGEARSGGCVHVSRDVLGTLIASGQLAVGQTVTIADGPPQPLRP